MPSIQSADITAQSTFGANSPRGVASARLQAYCGLDSCVTVEVWDALRAAHGEPPAIYSFERAIAAPYLEIMQRGFAVDELSRRREAAGLRQRMEALQACLDRLASAVWDRGLNPRSPLQLREFFYGALKLPEVWLSQKGERKLTTNREALEKLDTYMFARPFVACVLGLRDIAMQLDVLESQTDADGRWRAGYNIGGTETWRPSSSTNAFGTGGNAQNIAPGLRHVFVADAGYKLCQIDLEQVEARDVGYFCGCLFDDWSFLNACESGDLHTNNAKLIWPELPWTGDSKRDKEIASRPFYRDFSFRDMAKRGSHLSNYSGTAWTAARSLKVPLAIMEEFQARYVRGRDADPRKGLDAITPAYPCIPRWWQWTAQQIQTVHKLTNPFGATRHFFGRPDDPATLREAIAFLPQSTTALRMNLGLWRVWRHMPDVQLLHQGFDSITFQAKEGPGFDDRVSEALERVRVALRGPRREGRPVREYVVPAEAKVGWNWGNAVTAEDQAKAKAAGKKVPQLNPDGLIKWSPGGDRRERQVGLKRIML